MGHFRARADFKLARKYNLFGFYEYLGQNTPYMFGIAKSEYVDPYSPPLVEYDNCTLVY